MPVPSRSAITDPSFPRITPDLKARRGARGDVVVINGPRGEFEMYQVEWELARLMDGTRPMNELARVAREMGLPATLEHMNSLLRQFHAYGILESAPPQPRRLSQENLRAVDAPVERTVSAESPKPPAPPLGSPSGAAGEIQEVLLRGDVDIARTMAAAAYKANPKDPSLTETVRLFASYDRIKMERSAQQVPPGLARVPEPQPETVRPLFGVAEQLLRQGRREEAILLLEIAKRVEPSHPEAERLSNWILTGSEGESLQGLTDEVANAAAAVAEDAAASGEAAEAQEPQSEWAELKEARTRRRIQLAVAVLVLGAAAAALSVIQYPLKVTAEVTVRPLTRREVRATVEGVIVEAKKAEGDRVATGEVLAVLEKRELDAKLQMLQAQQAQIDAELNKLKAGNRPEEIRRARNALGQQQAALEHARSQLTRTQTLFGNKLASQAQLDQAKFEAEQEAANTARAKAELDLLLAGARKEDVAAKEAEEKRLDAEIGLVRADLEQKTIKSPLDGFLITPRFKESIGKAVKVGDMVAEVAQLDRMRAEISVPESEIDAVTVGQHVVLKVKAYPDRTFEGKVEMIAKTAAFVPEQQANVVRVVASIDNPDSLLRDEMTGFAEIVGDKQPLAKLVGRRLLRWIRVRFLV